MENVSFEIIQIMLKLGTIYLKKAFKSMFEVRMLHASQTFF
jgi:hypothetical protein